MTGAEIALIISNVALVIATIYGPAKATAIAERREERRQKRADKMRVFTTLMATRATAIDPRHVEALNQIDLVFSEKNSTETDIRNLWKAYLDHLIGYSKWPQQSIDQWERQRIDLLVDLLYAMGKLLGYDFDKVHIKNQGYYPTGLAKLATFQETMRNAWTELMEGKRALPIKIDLGNVTADDVVKGIIELKRMIDQKDEPKPPADTSKP